jgi:SET domain-containing protein
VTNPLTELRNSSIHGAGVFAVCPIPEGTRIIEYTGELITNKEADRRADEKQNDAHTFFYSLNKRQIVDAGVGGNESRFINHSCDPNCETRVERGHVYIYAIRDIPPGVELSYDYHLFLDRRLRKGEREIYACRCGSQKCRGTLLDPELHPPPRRKR